MNTVIKKRLLVGTIIILIVINISAISTIAFNKYQRSKDVELRYNNDKSQNDRRDTRPRSYHTRVKNFVKQELSLSDEQYEQYVKLKDINIEKSALLMQEIGNRKKLIFKTYCEETQDTVILNKIADETGSLHAEMQKETMRHFRAVVEILTPEQVVKFKLMLCEMSNRRGSGYYNQGNKGKRGRRGMKSE